MIYVSLLFALILSGCGSTLFNTQIDNPQVKSCIQWEGSGRGTFAPGFNGILRGVTATGGGEIEPCLKVYLGFDIGRNE